MKRKFFTLVTLALTLACAAPAVLSQSAGKANAAQWVGVWQSKLDGQPGATLTLARDTGVLDGTLVLDVVLKDNDGEPHVAASEPHTLVNPQFNGNTLTFSVKQLRNSDNLLNFTALLTPEGKLRIHCTNCGNAPVVDLTPAH
jgi:hypothetical protein